MASGKTSGKIRRIVLFGRSDSCARLCGVVNEMQIGDAGIMKRGYAACPKKFGILPVSFAIPEISTKMLVQCVICSSEYFWG